MYPTGPTLNVTYLDEIDRIVKLLNDNGDDNNLHPLTEAIHKYLMSLRASSPRHICFGVDCPEDIVARTPRESLSVGLILLSGWIAVPLRFAH